MSDRPYLSASLTVAHFRSSPSVMCVTTKMGLPSLLWPLGSKAFLAAPTLASVPTSVSGLRPSGRAPNPALEISSPLCPTCGVPMVLRTARRGVRQGQQFYGCTNFPQCRQMRQLGA